MNSGRSGVEAVILVQVGEGVWRVWAGTVGSLGARRIS